jgi:hypothetical protein
LTVEKTEQADCGPAVEISFRTRDHVRGFCYYLSLELKATSKLFQFQPKEVQAQITEAKKCDLALPGNG